MKTIKIIGIIFGLLCCIGSYLMFNFYRIEHVKNENEDYIITKKEELYDVISSNKEVFEEVIKLIQDDTSNTYDYYLTMDNISELIKNNLSLFTELRDNCNIVWIRTEPSKRHIYFNQIIGHDLKLRDDVIALSIICEIDDSGEMYWSIENINNANQGETESVIIRLYNFIYNTRQGDS